MPATGASATAAAASAAAATADPVAGIMQLLPSLAPFLKDTELSTTILGQLVAALDEARAAAREAHEAAVIEERVRERMLRDKDRAELGGANFFFFFFSILLLLLLHLPFCHLVCRCRVSIWSLTLLNCNRRCKMTVTLSQCCGWRRRGRRVAQGVRDLPRR
jgi:hypothetical protein